MGRKGGGGDGQAFFSPCACACCATEDSSGDVIASLSEISSNSDSDAGCLPRFEEKEAIERARRGRDPRFCGKKRLGDIKLSMRRRIDSAG